MTISKFLYHGTTESVARAVLKSGLLPRVTTGQKSNWPKAESSPDLIYLTSVYAPYFAMVASDKNNEKLALIEIDTSLLDENLFRPDEDFLEQASRGQMIKRLRAKTMHGRTRWFRNHIEEFSDMWKMSIENMGVISYKGNIPLSAITRVSIYNPKTNPYINNLCIDPAISILNFKYVGNKYAEITKWFFKELYNINVLIFGSPVAEEQVYNFRDIIQSVQEHLADISGLQIIDVTK